MVDKAKHRDSGEDCMVRSSDSALECNVVVVENQWNSSQVTSIKINNLEWIHISSIHLKNLKRNQL